MSWQVDCGASSGMTTSATRVYGFPPTKVCSSPGGQTLVCKKKYHWISSTLWIVLRKTLIEYSWWYSMEYHKIFFGVASSIVSPTVFYKVSILFLNCLMLDKVMPEYWWNIAEYHEISQNIAQYWSESAMIWHLCDFWGTLQVGIFHNIPKLARWPKGHSSCWTCHISPLILRLIFRNIPIFGGKLEYYNMVWCLYDTWMSCRQQKILILSKSAIDLLEVPVDNNGCIVKAFHDMRSITFGLTCSVISRQFSLTQSVPALPKCLVRHITFSHLLP